MSLPYRYIIFWNVGQCVQSDTDRLSTTVCKPEMLDYWRGYFGADNQTTEEEVLKRGYISSWQWYAVAAYKKPEPRYDDWEPVVRHFRD